MTEAWEKMHISSGLKGGVWGETKQLDREKLNFLPIYIIVTFLGSIANGLLSVKLVFRLFSMKVYAK